MNSSIEKWRGYAWDLPSGTIVEKKYKESELSLRRLLYARVLSQLDKRPSYPDSSYACDLSALWDVRYCGKGYGAYESSQGDVLIPWHKELGSMKYKHLWLCKGGMHKLWWACLDLNQSLFVPNEQA